MASLAVVAGCSAGTPTPTPTPTPTLAPTPASATTAPAPSAASVLPGGTFGELVFDDEFDGPAVDPAKWKVQVGHQDLWPDTPWRRNFKADNVYTREGALVIRTRSDDPGFSTGAIGTGDSTRAFDQAFGRFEARLKFSTQQGFTCGFWLWDESVMTVDGSGRDGSEIDIVEDFWLVDRVDHAIHWDGYEAAHQSAVQYVNGLGLDDGGWHTVRLDWYPDVYVFFIDGQETWRTDAGGVSQVPNHMLLTCEILNYGVGPDAMGVGPIEGAKLPDYFYVDYVRVWRYQPPR